VNDAIELGDDLLAQAIDAVRAAGDAVEPGTPAATVARVRHTMAARGQRARIWTAIAAALGIGLGGGAAWAIASGRWSVGAQPAAPTVSSVPREAPAAVPPRVRPARAMAPVIEATPIEEPPAERAPIATAPIATAKPVRRPHDHAIIEGAYRRAHELHFHGRDPSAALAAWDDYLRADPAGRFAAEARFNRAIDLVKLGRYDDARAALAPFARGEIAPAGYRRDQAQALIDRLDAIGRAPAKDDARSDSTIRADPGTPP